MLRRACDEATGARVRVVFAGGTTPRVVYELLVEKYRRAIPWERLEVFFGDERSVGPEDPESNFGLAERHLFPAVPIPREQIHRMRGEAEDLDRAASEYEERVRTLVPPGSAGVPMFDLVWLGFGADGHVASLFPGTRACDEREKLVVANPVPALETTRLTMTLPLLSAARRVQLLVTGEEKATAIGDYFVRRSSESPARAIAPADELEWVLDRAAATELTRDLYADME